MIKKQRRTKAESSIAAKKRLRRFCKRSAPLEKAKRKKTDNKKHPKYLG
jgi:hypothetical protein